MDPVPAVYASEPAVMITNAAGGGTLPESRLQANAWSDSAASSIRLGESFTSAAIQRPTITTLHDEVDLSARAVAVMENIRVERSGIHAHVAHDQDSNRKPSVFGSFRSRSGGQ